MCGVCSVVESIIYLCVYVFFVLLHMLLLMRHEVYFYVAFATLATGKEGKTVNNFQTTWKLY